MKNATLLCLLGVLLLGAGCSPPPTPVGFQNQLSKWNVKLGASAKSFNDTIDPLIQSNQPVDAAKVRSAYQNMEDAYYDVLDDVDSYKPPKNSSSGSSYLEAYRTFMQVQQQQLDRYKRIVSIVENTNLTPDQKRQQIRTLYAEMNREETKALAELEKAQQSFGSEHKLSTGRTSSGGFTPVGPAP